MILESDLRAQISSLLRTSGISRRAEIIAPCSKGGNNRLFKVSTDTGTYAVKQYFKGPGELRDRLGSEFDFLCYAQAMAPDKVPRAYGRDDSAGLAVYEFLQGRGYSPGIIGRKEVDAAAKFFVALNLPECRNSSLAHSLPYSAEACFSVQSHLDLVSGRLARLMEMPQNIAVDRKAHAFVKKMMVFWDDLVRPVKDRMGASLDQELPQEARCISPSDFGFHNALSGEDGKIWFIDFEYAGWDDPSRMVADFFSQLAVPVPDNYFKYFTNQVMSIFPEHESLTERASLLLSVYRIKWCCIALNVFLPKHLERRLFANPGLNEQRVKAEQLAKAESVLESVQKKEINNGLC